MHRRHVNFQEWSLCACALLNLPVPPSSWLGRGQYIAMQEPLRDYPTLRLQLSGQMAWPRLFEVRNADKDGNVSDRSALLSLSMETFLLTVTEAGK